ncbi:hypothetical protein SAICODRAFT_27041 [Saitoella complicata NRRL Y-17804]|uniref:uncharacterized protein n=1 Tax=Saitoella complicata (strain BCRC 22490 / CBS 7301 / JCM 7358 / NBRC 10748 / NRRL Y-17804) TaxID=698492 RepID=UPI0008676EA4|nr:uncharacterized protein SAICODRAFT_27041 [Saitoella complicata NRRL Y-17804]ODQ50966.1 hypothetical protein SAICODRAFT_27041 [Saitoella complicata NRRL Y-17804]
MTTLVQYDSSSDDDANERDPAVEPAAVSTLPSLPSTFHNLYATKPRVGDDPAFHQGRKRAHRHVEGQWATHIYTEFWPDVKLMSILDRIVKKAGSLDKGWTSLLVSELGNQLALHISLSRPLTLWTDEREDFTRALSRVLADIEPFEMTLDNISTFVNDERTRTFLVLEVNEGISEFGGVLRALEAVMKQFKQPALYTVDTARFHVSIAWRLGGEEMKVKQLLQFVEEFGEELQALWKDTSKTIRVKEVKAKIGNQIWVKKLGERHVTEGNHPHGGARS